ncbi:MAG: nitroreductase [Oscillospiraceae bacterium]|nr:nitroreductase [Oscillospiraceae bacterium]
MTTMELIRHRRSVRTFDGNPLGEEDAARLLAFAEKAENPYGLPIECRLLSAKADGLSSPVISGTDAWIAGKLKAAPHAEEAFGYEFESIVLFAESLGLGTTWIAGTMDRAAFEKAMDLAPGEVMPCVSPLGYPAKKMSLKETMMRKGVKADVRLPFEQLFFDGSFDVPLTPEKAGAAAELLEMVRWAPSAVNKQPWRVLLLGGTAHFYEKKSRGFAGKDGWDLQKIDVGIAMNHLSAGLAERGAKADFTFADPGLPMPADTEYIASCLIY